jgi:predicted nucleic acid-binding protein
VGLIYLDSCAVIYLVEEHAQFGPMVRAALAGHAEHSFAISPLVRLECLVGPLREPHLGLVPAFQAAFLQFVNLKASDGAVDDAARIRATHGMRTSDALHLAIARAAGCTALWTNDDRFAKAAPGFALDFRAL